MCRHFVYIGLQCKLTVVVILRSLADLNYDQRVTLNLNRISSNFMSLYDALNSCIHFLPVIVFIHSCVFINLFVESFFFFDAVDG